MTQEARRRAAMYGLGGLCGLLLAAVAGIFAAIIAQQHQAGQNRRDNAAWASSRLEWDATQLLLHLRRAAPAAISGPEADRLATRYAVLTGRAALLDRTLHAATAEDAVSVTAPTATMLAELRALAPLFASLEHQHTAPAEAVAAALPRVEALSQAASGLAHLLHTRTEAARIRAETQDRRLVLSFATAVALLTLTMAALVGTLAFSRRALRRLSRDLAEALDRAEAATRAKSAFLAMMTHEVRTPIAGVVGLAEMLADSPLRPEQAAQVATIGSCTAALIDLIDDILDLSRLEAGMMRGEGVAFDLVGLVREVCALVEPQARRKEIGFKLDLAPGLPPLRLGDPRHLRQVLLNLLGNALKFTEYGGVELAVRAGAHGVRFEVRDTGVGIPPAAQPHIFDTFVQGDATMARRFGGAGLGLALSRQLVELMGGDIGVSSSPGQGSRFWFELTLPEATADAAAPAARPGAQHTAGRITDSGAALARPGMAGVRAG